VGRSGLSSPATSQRRSTPPPIHASPSRPVMSTASTRSAPSCLQDWPTPWPKPRNTICSANPSLQASPGHTNDCQADKQSLARSPPLPFGKGWVKANIRQRLNAWKRHHTCTRYSGVSLIGVATMSAFVCSCSHLVLTQRERE